ncbi:MAPEG family protein [Kushneria marisflavi]|uniref:Uncharacterized protein n=1 Tax=Kushneria marisflavi TaxID=157779 RepID=A0A240UPN3_9GAMM|nr:MAPEG family protein [Kushneria marisflavi]ART63448.1 hypothetical protein B9H00_10560 [Kushneria marisflavi]RKD84506.1 hypothetical protein C8D96_2567 [Kushneria marisflavi]
MKAAMLAPAAVLILWSLIMLFWMAFSRFRAMKEAGGDLRSAQPSGRGQDLEGVLPERANWKAHNYTHLMEQPTIFYPAVIILAVMGASPVDVFLAWAYVLFRIIHSVYQATVNRVAVRFPLFLVSTLALIGLAVRAVMVTLFSSGAI